MEPVLLGVAVVLVLALVLQTLSWLKAQRQVGILERAHRQALDALDNARTNAGWWEQRYNTLLKEYNELDEIEEGEEYVRKSLGMPPEDEDHEESA